MDVGRNASEGFTHMDKNWKAVSNQERKKNIETYFPFVRRMKQNKSY